MSCCGGGGISNRLQTKGAARPRAASQPTGVLGGALVQGGTYLRYNGSNVGLEPWMGKVTKMTYHFSAQEGPEGDADKYRVKLVADEDVSHFLSIVQHGNPMFTVVNQQGEEAEAPLEADPSWHERWTNGPAQTLRNRSGQPSQHGEYPDSEEITGQRTTTPLAENPVDQLGGSVLLSPSEQAKIKEMRAAEAEATRKAQEEADNEPPTLEEQWAEAKASDNARDLAIENGLAPSDIEPERADGLITVKDIRRKLEDAEAGDDENEDEEPKE